MNCIKYSTLPHSPVVKINNKDRIENIGSQRFLWGPPHCSFYAFDMYNCTLITLLYKNWVLYRPVVPTVALDHRTTARHNFLWTSKQLLVAAQNPSCKKVYPLTYGGVSCETRNEKPITHFEEVIFIDSSEAQRFKFWQLYCWPSGGGDKGPGGKVDRREWEGIC